MKARVKATGEIVEVYRYGKPYYIEYIGEKPGRTFYPEELDLLDDNPDYWTRLEHQYAGMAMQGLLSNHSFFADADKVTSGNPQDLIVRIAESLAHALVEKMKGKEERK